MDRSLVGQILEMNSRELAAYLPSLPPQGIEASIARALFDYLKGDLDGLRSEERNIKGIESLEIWHKLRVRLLKKEICESDLKMDVTPGDHFEEIFADILFLRARSWSTLERYEESEKLYFEASRAYLACGMERKSLKALHNRLIALEKSRKNVSSFKELSDVYEAAKNLGEDEIAAYALINMAWQLESQIGAEGALGLYLKAEEHLNRISRGSIYWECQLYIVRSLLFSAKIETAQARLRSFRMGQFQSADRLYKKIARQFPIVREWNKDLSAAEKRLLSYLEAGPIALETLLRLLYGARMEDTQALRARFHNLVYRMRKHGVASISIEAGQVFLGSDTQDQAA